MPPASQLLTTQQYTKLLTDLRRIIGEGKQEAERAAAQALIESYWAIGKRITKEKLTTRAGYHNAILRDLRADLDIHLRNLQLYSDGAQRLGIVDVQHARTVHPDERPAASAATLIEPIDPDRVSFDLEESCDPANPEQNRCPDDQGRCFRCREAGDGYHRLSFEPALPLFEAVQRYKSDQALNYKDCGELSPQRTDLVRVNDCFAKAFTACNPAELRVSWTGTEAAQSPVVLLAEPRNGTCVAVYFFEHEDHEANTTGLLRNECKQLSPERTLADCRLVEVRSGPPRSKTPGAGGTGPTPR